MPLNLARCGGGVLQHQLNQAFSRPVRQAIVQSHVRPLSLITLGRLSSFNARPAPVSVALSRGPSNTYATAASKPTKATKATDATKSPKSPKATKAQKTSKTPKAPKDTDAPSKERKPKMTVQEKERKDRAKERDLVAKTKIATLVSEEPKRPLTAYMLAIIDKMKEIKAAHSDADLPQTEIFRLATEAAKTISAEEKEKYTSTWEASKEAYPGVYRKWVESYTPIEIKQANLARKQLARLRNKKPRYIQDDRLVKRPKASYILYAEERLSSSDLHDLPVPERSKHVGAEWNNMTKAQKEPYVVRAAEDAERYKREYLAAYGIPVPESK
ncbi:hypothetical protein BO70DRAFT_362343 [Aspergillus heteromorphus CBS 117.55]|uniref:HMG box domain-containing protein n=1 Tax=Aspergillus heteromorphus CBS 117.55 TaxID=1448321 RepID=A0A317W761_9EURO|nr:uncharacterized protein BO70DRAFT_362343 [Aspergillus heteromorphus CBS 117.55]PWY81909.1 hypothetical protein BO70DRAFT_362343 [Aspergillus heteromorphus CBS 117.55]